MRYLVTGAAGFIGSHLSEALRAEGYEIDVVVLDIRSLAERLAASQPPRPRRHRQGGQDRARP